MSDRAHLVPVPVGSTALPALAASGAGSLDLFTAGRPEFGKAPGICLKTAEWKSACEETYLGAYINAGLSPDAMRFALATERQSKVAIRIYRTGPVPGIENVFRMPSRPSSINSRGEIQTSLRCIQWLTRESLLLVWGEGFLQILDVRGQTRSLGGNPLAPLLEAAHVSRPNNTLVTVGFPTNRPSRYPVGTVLWDLAELEAGRFRRLDHVEIFAPEYPIPARVAFHPDGRHLVAIAGSFQEDGRLSIAFLARDLWTRSTRIFHEYHDQTRIPKALEFSPTGDLYIEDSESIRRFDRRFKLTGRWEIPRANRDFPASSLSPDGEEIAVQAETGISILTPETGAWRHAHQQEGGSIRCWFLETGKLFALHFGRGAIPAAFGSGDSEPPAWRGDSFGQGNLAWHILPSGGFLLGGRDGRVRHFDAGLRSQAVFDTGLGPIDEIWGPQGCEEALILSTSGAVLHFRTQAGGESRRLPYYRNKGSETTFANGSWVKRWVHNPWCAGEPPAFTDIDSRPRFTSSDTYFQWRPDKKRVGHFRTRHDWDLRQNPPLAEFHPLRPGERPEHLINIFGLMAVLTSDRIVMWNPDSFKLTADIEGVPRLVEDGVGAWTALDGFYGAIQLGYQTGNDIFLCFRDELWRLAFDSRTRRLHVTARAKMPGLVVAMHCPRQEAFWMTGPQWYRKFNRDLETIADFLPLPGDAHLVHVPHPWAAIAGAAPHPGWLWIEGGPECWDWVEVKDAAGKIVEERAEKIRIGSRYLSRSKVEQALLDYPAFKARMRESGKGRGWHGMEEVMLLLPSSPTRNEAINPASEESK